MSSAYEAGFLSSHRAILEENPPEACCSSLFSSVHLDTSLPGNIWTTTRSCFSSANLRLLRKAQAGDGPLVNRSEIDHRSSAVRKLSSFVWRRGVERLRADDRARRGLALPTIRNSDERC